ncbi:FAD dependent oxidoreductase [Cubamyces lactineus]|nr:FAD dependent oxidoreductase [Cubamyces lactineus]
MGSVVSKAQLLYQALIQLHHTYDVLRKRIEASPGLPVPNPTLPLWTVPPASIPPKSDPIDLPQHADVVIIGSGITGTSVAYNLLAREAGLSVVMLEARQVCSGATGRNGGHVNPPLYHDYAELKEKYGAEVAKTMVAFRRAHLAEVRRIAIEEGILQESQVRETEHLDVFTCPKAFAESKAKLAEWRAAMPLESSSFVAYEREEAIKKYRLSDQVLGCISNSGGAMHPYHYVTSLLSILLDRHSDSLQIFTQTPCTGISTSSSVDSSSAAAYAVVTPRGTIRATHVVHATNGWCSHLLPALRAKIAPARGAMSAQRPGTSLNRSTLAGARSYVFYRGTAGYDYLTQLPDAGEHGGDLGDESENELMFGGGWAQACDDGLPEIGIADDSVVNHASQSYLAGALPQYFGLQNWGGDVSAPETEEGDGGDGVRWNPGRTKAQWSGVLGISADLLPWVGRVPAKLTKRSPPKQHKILRAHDEGGKDEARRLVHLAAPGEWIAAGYSGEGMVHAWMSGKALAHMILDKDDEIRDWFPDILRVTEQRWKNADFDRLVSRFISA